jgi:hypothetical protein
MTRPQMTLTGLVLVAQMALPPPETPARGAMCLLGEDTCERQPPERAPEETAPQPPLESIAPPSGDEGDCGRHTALRVNGRERPEHRTPLERPPRS